MQLLNSIMAVVINNKIPFSEKESPQAEIKIESDEYDHFANDEKLRKPKGKKIKKMKRFYDR